METTQAIQHQLSAIDTHELSMQKAIFSILIKRKKAALLLQHQQKCYTGRCLPHQFYVQPGRTRRKTGRALSQEVAGALEEFVKDVKEIGD